MLQNFKKWNAQISKVCPDVFSTYTLFPQSIRALNMNDWSSKNQNSSPEESQKQRIRLGMLIWKIRLGMLILVFEIWPWAKSIDFQVENLPKPYLASVHGYVELTLARFWWFRSPSGSFRDHKTVTESVSFWILENGMVCQIDRFSCRYQLKTLFGQRSWVCWANPSSVLMVSKSIGEFSRPQNCDRIRQFLDPWKRDGMPNRSVFVPISTENLIWPTFMGMLS